MNIIIIEENEIENQSVILTGRRAEHIRKIHKATAGKKLQVGLLDGLIGTATVQEVTKQQVILENIELSESSPKPVDIKLALAMPRPPTLKKVLQGCIELGVKDITLFGSKRVEKSFWDSSLLQPEQLKHQILLGLEQAVDTIQSEIKRIPYFKKFINEFVKPETKQRNVYFGHPATGDFCPHNTQEPATIIVGPEGGFIPYEVDELLAAGCTPVNLGERILRVEHAAFAMLAKLTK